MADETVEIKEEPKIYSAKEAISLKMAAFEA